MPGIPEIAEMPSIPDVAKLIEREDVWGASFPAAPGLVGE